jgi:hypothetical protein
MHSLSWSEEEKFLDRISFFFQSIERWATSRSKRYLPDGVQSAPLEGHSGRFLKQRFAAHCGTND